MPANVDTVTPVASSSAGNDTSNAVPPVASVPSVPSSVAPSPPRQSSNVFGPSTAPFIMPTSSAADAMITSLFDTVTSRAAVAPVVSPIVPSTPSDYSRYTGTVIGNLNEIVGSEPEELVGSPELVMSCLDICCLFRTDWSLRGRGSFDWDDIENNEQGRASGDGMKRVRLDLSEAILQYVRAPDAYMEKLALDMIADIQSTFHLYWDDEVFKTYSNGACIDSRRILLELILAPLQQ